MDESKGDTEEEANGGKYTCLTESHCRVRALEESEEPGDVLAFRWHFPILGMLNPLNISVISPTNARWQQWLAG